MRYTISFAGVKLECTRLNTQYWHAQCYATRTLRTFLGFPQGNVWEPVPQDGLRRFPASDTFEKTSLPCRSWSPAVLREPEGIFRIASFDKIFRRTFRNPR
jgi:hypothetical protein